MAGSLRASPPYIPHRLRHFTHSPARLTQNLARKALLFSTVTLLPCFGDETAQGNFKDGNAMETVHTVLTWLAVWVGASVVLGPLAGRCIRNGNIAPPPAPGLAAEHASGRYAERIAQELKAA